MIRQTLFSVANRVYRGLQQLVNAASLGARAIIIDDQDRILLVKHTYTGGWHLPGGGVNHGESPIQAVIREIREETGLEVTQAPQLLGIYTSKIHGVSDYPVIYVVKDFKVIKDAKISFEIQQAKWFALKNLPPDIQVGTQKRIGEYLNNIPPNEFW